MIGSLRGGSWRGVISPSRMYTWKPPLLSNAVEHTVVDRHMTHLSGSQVTAKTLELGGGGVWRL